MSKQKTPTPKRSPGRQPDPPPQKLPGKRPDYPVAPRERYEQVGHRSQPMPRETFEEVPQRREGGRTDPDPPRRQKR